MPKAVVATLTVVAALAAVGAMPAANRTAGVDGRGVMRWNDDGGEVAVFGVNYYAPFALDYRVLKERGFDIRETIRRDVAQFRRLGLTAIRLHCFDYEFSTRDGAFVDNDHVDALDYLVANAASNGIYTILTPMAAWGGDKWTSCTNGFAYKVPMAQLTTNPRHLAPQVRFEEEFARHVNRYTGRRFADDPAVLCFELINEPNYPEGTKPEQVAAYANRLLEGIRRSGTRKPVFYNATWNWHNDCVPLLNTDGVSGVYYATGLQAGSALEKLQLFRVRGSSLKADRRLDGKAKIVYEFDAADTPGSYMYPAMARLFRHEGVQSATQFQYDPTAIADDNASYRTHYLNLVYTPSKAISLAIAAEAFRRLPRGTEYAPDAREQRFGEFRVNAAEDLSEMVTETEFLYSNSTKTTPPSPERLNRVWGCGSSSVAEASGNGAYFLDRVADGVWRLQMYPSVRQVADPYTGFACVKTVVETNRRTLRLRLPDLGSSFGVWRTDGGRSVWKAVGGRLTLEAGDYVLTRAAWADASGLSAARKADLPEYWAPPPVDGAAKMRRWPPTIEERVADKRSKAKSAREANFFDAEVASHANVNGGWIKKTRDSRNRAACRFNVPDFIARDAVSIRIPTDGPIYARAFPQVGRGKTLVVSGRSAMGASQRVEIALEMDDGEVWGLNATLQDNWCDLRIPLADFRYFKHWQVPEWCEGFALDMRRVVSVHFCIGKWLEPDATARAHAFEISAIRVED